MNTKNLVLCGMFTALICVCSIIMVPLPFTPAPVTLQTFAVTLAGLCLGKKYGVLAVTCYVLLGAIGLPVYAGGSSGLGVLLGITGGFFWGFILGVFTIGLVYERLRGRAFSTAAAVISGNLAIYVCGAAWYMLYADISFARSAAVMVLPFMPGDALKILTSVLAAKFLTAARVLDA